MPGRAILWQGVRGQVPRKPRPEPLRPEQMKDRTGDDCINLVRDRVLEMMARYRRHPLLADGLKPLPGSGRVIR